METYDSIKTELTQRLDEMRARVAAIRHDRRKKDGPLSPDWEEQALDLENDEVLDHLDTGGRQEVKQILVALRRLEAGTYGVCDACGGRIPAGRLKALPFATRCVACAA